MRGKLKRYYGSGHLHFITCSCYRRQPLLGTPRGRDLFLTVLEQVRRRYAFVVIGYVVMPEHIHLLISEPQEKNPSTVMQAVKLGFARRVLASAKRRRNPAQASLLDHGPQHIRQKRFYDFNVWSERKRIEKLRHMHRNPVKRGLVISPELWRWSSFRAYALGEAGRVGVNKWEVLKMKIRPAAAQSEICSGVGGAAGPFSEGARRGAPPFLLCKGSTAGRNFRGLERSQYLV
jgi:putative transposase